MNKVFEHFHLSLVERSQLNLLDTRPTREEWIRSIFSLGFTFKHHAKDFSWVSHTDGGDLITGTICKQKQRTQHRPPEDGASEFLANEWQGSVVIIDPVHRPDGQKLAFERDLDVGKPAAILASLVSDLNARVDAPYQIVIKPLFDAESFRAFAKRHGELVEYVNFSFVVPNMFFGASTSVNEGLKRIGSSTGAQTVDLRLKSDEGVKTDSADVTAALDYAEAGNGSVTSKAMNGETYSSTKRRKKVKMLGILDDKMNKIERVNWFLRALGREQNDSLGIADRSNSDTDGS